MPWTKKSADKMRATKQKNRALKKQREEHAKQHASDMEQTMLINLPGVSKGIPDSSIPKGVIVHNRDIAPTKDLMIWPKNKIVLEVDTFIELLLRAAEHIQRK